MRIALAQIDTTVGDLAGNGDLVLDWAERARLAGAELVVFPEMTLTGYPPQDLLESAAFLAACSRRLDELESAVRVPCLVGFAEAVANGRIPGAHNSAALIGTGQRTCFRKTLLPTYDVFDETRHFQPAARGEPHVFELGGITFGVTICEDMWNSRQEWPEARYVEDPIAEVAAAGSQVIVNLSASPYSSSKPELRQQLAAAHARRHGVPMLFCNLVGGNDALVFDGASFAIDSKGSLCAAAAFCEPGLVVVDVDAASGSVTGEVTPLPDRESSRSRRALALGVADYARKCGFKTAVLGLSGGIDSALVAAIATDALGAENVTCITMPGRYSSTGSVDDSVALCANLGCTLLTISIEQVFESYLATLEPVFVGREPDVTEENLQARIRGALLMAHSNKFGSLLLSTGNKSEVAVGYCTLYGDMCGGLAVISDLYKMEVYELAREFNVESVVVPQAILEKAPSAELRPDQLDQDSLPPYDELDRVLEAYIERAEDAATIAAATGIDRVIVAEVLRMVDRNEYKRRQMPPGLRLSAKAFGSGRRFPIARARFDS